MKSIFTEYRVIHYANFRIDILPSLKQMGFLDTNARNPDITIAGITLALQFGNALPSIFFYLKL